MPSDGLNQRVQQCRHAAHPVRQGGAVEVDTLAGVDRTLTIQRQAVGVFCHRDVSEQTRTRPAALDRERRQRRLHDRLAGPAAQPRPHQLDHLEGGGDVFEQFGHVLAELAQYRAAAAGAGRRRLMHDALARQVRRQGFAAARLAVGRCGARRDYARFVFGLLGADLILCHALFELADQELELLDVAVELLQERPKRARRSTASCALRCSICSVLE